MGDGRRRVVIESVTPEIDGGRFPAKRTMGERITVEADIFADGHDAISSVLRWRHQSSTLWNDVPMVPIVNDRWRGEFMVSELGRYLYTIQGWVDAFETWSRQFAKRVEADQEITLELEVAARMVEAAASRADGSDSNAVIDLNTIDFDALAARLAGRKRSGVRKLASQLEKRVDDAARRNPSRIDLVERLRTLIDEYNAGSLNVDEMLRRLQALSQQLSEEEQRTVREDNIQPKHAVTRYAVARSAPDDRVLRQ